MNRDCGLHEMGRAEQRDATTDLRSLLAAFDDQVEPHGHDGYTPRPHHRPRHVALGQVSLVPVVTLACE
jgi:hypothetical protein